MHTPTTSKNTDSKLFINWIYEAVNYINMKFKKMIKKKFKVRVKHFYECNYVVQYADYRFVTVWYSICFWFSKNLTSGEERWLRQLFSAEDAEKLAKSFKSIEDIKFFNKPEENKMVEFIRRKREYQKNNKPYEIKEVYP